MKGGDQGRQGPEADDVLALAGSPAEAPATPPASSMAASGPGRRARRRLALDWLELGPALAWRQGSAAPAGDDAGAAGDETTSTADPAGFEAGQALEAGPPPAPVAEVPALERLESGSLAVDEGLARAGGDDAAHWEALQAEVRACTACGLATTRRQTVFGVGPLQAELMIIGEAPGAEEDARGEPFVGQAGKLLDQMLAAIGLSREKDVFICNVLKCRPPGNRNPAADEVAACADFLERQIAIVRPKVVLLLGSFAIRSILATEASVGSQRGRIHRRKLAGMSLPVIVSYHPAYLLRNLVEKRKSWEDLLLLADQLEAARQAPPPA